jgi:hypothetical protein
VGLEAYGIEIVERIPVEIKLTPWNIRYLRTKQEKMGHIFAEEDLKLDDATSEGTHAQGI